MNPMTDPTNAVSSEAPSTLLSNLFCRSRQPSSSSLVMVHKIPKSGLFQWMHACAEQQRNERSFPLWGFHSEQNQSLPYHIQTNTRQQKFAHASSRTVNNTARVNHGLSVHSPGGSGGSESKQRRKCHSFKKASQASRQPQQGA